MPASERVVPIPYYISVDLETSTGRPLDGGIIEIGAVVSNRDGYILDFFGIKSNPFLNPDGTRETSLTWDPEAEKIHGMTQAFVEKQMPIKNALLEFNTWTSGFPGHVLIAHNTHFDIGFLRLAFERAHIVEPPSFWSCIDIPTVAHIPLANGSSMPSSREMARYTGINNIRPHSAVHDALAAMNHYWYVRRAT